MLATERRRRILEQVRAHGDVSLRELAQSVLASEVTVRRDLRALEEQGLLDRRRGGAVTLPAADQATGGERPEQAAEKSAIARLAATLVAEGDVVALGAGTTTQHLAAALVGVRALTVVTNSLLVGEALSQSTDATVLITGGALRGSTYGLVGRGAEETFADLRVRRAFLSGDGVSSTWGLSTTSSDQAGVDRMITESAQELVVLADHTKLGHESAFQTVPPDRITHLVTDELADPALLAAFVAAGLQVHVAPLEGDALARSEGPR
ncbi:DeoR family transcriptional regulator [Cellulomonas sp. WB94]|uniref:DeoR/GlpR family DNA-binding transcription regulator n=1 Tax=Cellulomonas sp. WB94 TaxID=2173174 RepID=UPI000D57B807|nr:DeoR/GlpR family DNA-binding transcription regulator [Cellulomonas sp. WB94]PVU83996.1 DeoR family transcriptional regulator [Cellulomonas sp. WB94]